MVFNKNKKQIENPATDRVAKQIASLILRWQQEISVKANRCINRLSRRRQKKILWLFCATWAILLTVSVTRIPIKQVIRNSVANLFPVHIGQASNTPKRAIKNLKQTDSLTNKK